MVIEDLADENALLREANLQLVDLVADLALENVTLRLLYDRECRSRIYGDGVIARLQRQRRDQPKRGSSAA